MVGTFRSVHVDWGGIGGSSRAARLTRQLDVSPKELARALAYMDQIQPAESDSIPPKSDEPSGEPRDNVLQQKREELCSLEADQSPSSRRFKAGCPLGDLPVLQLSASSRGPGRKKAKETVA
jgi:hypothetical protein